MYLYGIATVPDPTILPKVRDGETVVIRQTSDGYKVFRLGETPLYKFQEKFK